MNNIRNGKHTTYFYIHLFELKYNIILYIYLFCSLFSICYFFSNEIIFLLINPLLKVKKTNYFILSTLTEAFFMKIFISFFLSFFLFLPFLSIHIWSFLSEGLYKYENIIYLKILFLILCCFFFSFYFILIKIIPHTWEFLLYYEKKDDTIYIFNTYLEPRLENYLKLIINMIFLISLFFQYILFLLIIIYLKIISLKNIIMFKKIIYLKILIIATLLSPPDILSQFLLSIPIIFLFEIFIFLSLMFKNYKKLNI